MVFGLFMGGVFFVVSSEVVGSDVVGLSMRGIGEFFYFVF